MSGKLPVLDYFTEMEECLQTCPKLQESRAPLMENASDVNRINEKLAELRSKRDLPEFAARQQH